MPKHLERFATLPDHYVFTAEDGPMVAAIAPHGNVVYATSGDGALLYITAFGSNVRTASDLRGLLQENPPPPEGESRSPFAPIMDVIGGLIDETASERVRGRVLRDLLYEKGVITREEWAQKLEAEYRRAFWALRDGFIPLKEEQIEQYKIVYADYLAEEQRREALFPTTPGGLIPPPPENRSLIFPNTDDGDEEGDEHQGA